MSKFVLKPMRVLQTRLSPVKGEPNLELTFQEMFRKFVPDRDPNEGLKLGKLRVGDYMGVVKSAKTANKLVVFYLQNPDGTGNIDFVLKNDPSFGDRVLCAYRVEEAIFDSKFSETAETAGQ